MSLIVVPTGTANIASVLAGLRRLGESPVLGADPDLIRAADRVVLPGVGSFGAAGAELDRVGLREVIRERVVEGRPTLAVCVGMQLLARSSEESVGAEGLGVIDRSVRRFPDEVRVPQLGWNRIVAGSGCRFVTDGWAYFANSFRIDSVPEGWSAATTDHGGEFVSALERGEVLACQFHPELSGVWGSALLGRWLGRAS
ncbi:MAG TPA: imidazole glycerol phosphate synthase subunit HisH [Acidimicrobiia bacterium]|nr:imidazole glycerol phosphate synthase subunit HisH [Acidimicrobiia bacterium]